MNYQQTIEYLYNTLPMFSRMGSIAFKKGLANTLLLCDRLGNPQNQFKSIHVAGTNGKGSVSHMLAAIFQTAGYKTGLYTSPHLYDFRERIKINGAMADEEFIVEFVEKMKPVIEEIQPSFFEITVVMAFEYFAKQKVDVAIVEVGLGGRLDSTNVIRPELSIITNIGWDHMNMLGNTLEEIAFEKAGIIKEKVPIVIGEKQMETENVFKNIANQKNAPIYFTEERFVAKEYELASDRIGVSFFDRESQSTSTYYCNLPGIYQTKNIGTVLQAAEIIKARWSISPDHIHKALENSKTLTGLHGRWEVIYQKPTVVLEVAHNKNGIEQMLRHIQKLNFARLHVIFGMVKDKEVEPVLELLPKDAHYYFTQSHIPRSLDAASLQLKSSTLGLKGNAYDDVNLAILEAMRNASPNDLIIVCGSIFLVAEVNRDIKGLMESSYAKS